MIKDVITLMYWYPFRFFIQRIPFKYTHLLAKAFGIVLYYLLAKKRNLLERELLDVFDGRTKGRNLKKAVQGAFVNFSQNEAEVLIYPKLDKKNISYFIEYSGLDHLDDALAKGKGVILLFAHFGANQMIMPAIGYRGYRMSQLSSPPTVWVEKLPDKKFSHIGKMGLEIRWKHELSLPVTHINIFGSLKEAFLCLRRNEVLGVAIDGGGGKERAAVDFLDRKILLSTGAIEIAMRTGCAVLPTFMIRRKDGRHRMIIEQPLEIRDQKVYKDAIYENLSAFVGRLEEYLIKYPCHYLNFLALRRFMEGVDGIPFIIEKERIHAESIAN
ncbi:MAG TPA: lysophospholipid acyltransferase family protein [Nitrospiria bacterium]|nr:lysophospholipid acyltransferase family protein [Nitrospiria bacterium]